MLLVIVYVCSTQWPLPVFTVDGKEVAARLLEEGRGRPKLPHPALLHHQDLVTLQHSLDPVYRHITTISIHTSPPTTISDWYGSPLGPT